MPKNQNTMNTHFTPFKIGEQYENWEFDLEPVNFTKTCDQYRYLKTDQREFFSIPIEQILLSFNLDILFQVEYHFQAKYFQQLKVKLIEFLTKGTFRDYSEGWEWEDEYMLLILLKSKTRIMVIVKAPIRILKTRK